MRPRRSVDAAAWTRPVIYSFSGYEVDTDRVEVRHDGDVIHAEPQVFEVLRCLIERRDRVVTKIEMLDEIWDGFVSEAALTSRIKSVRQLFGDSGRAQQVIRTVHGKGYQFIADVVEGERAASDGPGLPSGTVTFLVTEIERSVWLWEHRPEAMSDIGRRHDDILRAAVEAQGGTVFASPSSGVSAGFPLASDAIAAARRSRELLAIERWPGGIDLRVRLAVHTGEAIESDGRYGGTALNRAAAVLAAAHGGQTLMSDVTASLVPADQGFTDLGMCAIDPAMPTMRLWQLDGGSFPAPTGAIASALPALRVELVGRDDVLDRVTDAVGSHRLVSIVGPGGAGKTTLALAAANSLVPSFPGGVVFVELASVRDSDGLLRVVAETAGIEGAAAADQQSLATHIARRPALLVLDNCEHLLVSCATFVDNVLDAGAAVTIVCTSRESLAVDGELLVPLGSLEDRAPELFVQRARTIAPGAALDPDDPRVIDLCARLDGLPLAIELAAAQLHHLGIDDLLGRLGDALALSGPGRTRGRGRHATLERTIQWSYDLLDDEARELLRNFGVFPGTFDLRAAEAVGRAPLAVLSDLVAKNLVVHDRDTGRYRLLETIRAFVAQQLEVADQSEEASARLIDHVVAEAKRTDRIDRWFSGANAATFRADLDSARLAFDRLLDDGRVVDALEITIACCYLFRTTLNGIDGRRWIARLSLAADDLNAGDRLWFHLVRADLAQGSADHLTGRDAAERATDLADEADAPTSMIANHLGALHLVVPDPQEATKRFTEAARGARDAGLDRIEHLMGAFAAMAALSAGEVDHGAELAEEVAHDVAGDGYEVFIAHWAAWTACLLRGDTDRLRYWTDRQRSFLLGAGVTEPWLFLWSVALLHAMEGGDAVEGLRLARERADNEGHDVAADIVLALAIVAQHRGHLVEAAELLGAIAGARLNNLSHYVLGRNLQSRLQAELGGARLTAASDRGSSATPASILAGRGLDLMASASAG